MIDKNDVVGLPDTNTDETNTNYYSDVFTSGEVKEQLKVGNEVATPKSVSGTIDTSDAGITKIDNSYTLSVPNPDGVIFSITIDGMSKVFKVGYFNNSALAYSTLEDKLQAWLGTDYTVTYTSGTNYTITRYDGVAISKSEPNLVRTITLTGFDTISIIDVIVDGTTISLNGATHSGSAPDALDYLITQLPSNTYYTTRSSNVLTIARINSAVPVITKTQYNKYDYLVKSRSTNIFTSGDDVDYVKVTIDGTSFDYTYPSPPFNHTFVDVPLGLQTGLNKESIYGTIAFDIMYGGLSGSYTKSAITTWTVSGVDFWGYQATIHKSYAQITGPAFIYKINGSGTEISGSYVTMTETNHLADITVATATEITITLTLSANAYLIPCAMNIKKIVMTADASGGRSEGTYELRDQSCTAHYSTTTVFVADKIFKTDASNFGNIAEINRRGGFVMQWTTNTSNKLTFTCT